MQYNELINGLTEALGITDLTIINGATALEIDDMTLGIFHDEKNDAVKVVVEFGYPPPDANGHFGAMLLKANYLLLATEGATLCQNPDTDAYGLTACWPLMALDVKIFANKIEEFINKAEEWKNTLSGMGEAEDALEEAEMEEEDAMEAIAAGDFIRI